jgi:hypothetical protein
MGNDHGREAELRARISRLERELARAKLETEAWRRLFARTTRVIAAFSSEMDDLLRAARSGQAVIHPSTNAAADPAEPVN